MEIEESNESDALGARDDANQSETWEHDINSCK